MEYTGLLGGVLLLIWLAMRGVDIVFAAVLSSLLVIITNGLPLALVLLTILLPRLVTLLVDDTAMATASWPFGLLRFAVSQPIVWPRRTWRWELNPGCCIGSPPWPAVALIRYPIAGR